ncbi:unnamed protein product [Boreogadus saida]
MNSYFPVVRPVAVAAEGTLLHSRLAIIFPFFRSLPSLEEPSGCSALKAGPLRVWLRGSVSFRGIGVRGREQTAVATNGGAWMDLLLLLEEEILV